MKTKNLFYFLLPLSIFIFFFIEKKERFEQSVWGPEKVDDPIIKKLLDFKVMQRIKKVDQSGPTPYFGLVPFFSRYEHCVGVWALLKKAKVSRQEQIVGLLHDASHTAFSHIADHLFRGGEKHKHSYQDEIHVWYLKRMGVEPLTREVGLTGSRLDPDSPEYKALERPLPQLCADRIHYNIHTGVLFKKITSDEAKLIVQNLHYEKDQWFFKTLKAAQKFAYLPLYFTQNLWGSPLNCAFYHYFTEILKRALSLKIITKDEFHFGTDPELLEKLKSSKDEQIQRLLKYCQDIQKHYKVVLASLGDFQSKPKFRGVDPLVCLEGQPCQMLTQIDPVFKKEFNRVMAWCKKGYGVKLFP